MWIDTHCHLDFPQLRPQLPELLQRMQKAGVRAAITIGTSLSTAAETIAVAESEPYLWASIGVHPDHCEGPEPTFETLYTLGRHPKVVAIGETGLDYYRGDAQAPAQRARFALHIEVAKALQLPLVVHMRAASDETLAMLRSEGAEQVGGVMHCFTESRSVARAALELGFYISFSGIVTFKNAASVREVARYVPLDRLLVETDAPFLAPVPHRGKVCEPAFVCHTGACLAELLGVTPEELAMRTSENAIRLFRLDKFAESASAP